MFSSIRIASVSARLASDFPPINQNEQINFLRFKIKFEVKSPGFKDILDPKHRINASILSSFGTFAMCSSCLIAGMISE